MNIIICTLKSWNIERANELKTKYNVLLITKKEDLVYEKVREFSPDYIFFPHWSDIIPSQIYGNFNCVVFHMTDLPFGRGGSPLQNLLARGIYETKISAIKVTKGIDEGDIFLKKELNISYGSASDIFRRASKIIFEEMIPYILENKPTPKTQVGEPIVFSRRKPSDGELLSDFPLIKLYDYIRMLDAEGYQNAFIPFGAYRITFKEADIDGNILTAKVEISKPEGDCNE